MNSVAIDSGSFRDPSGHVYLHKNRVFRTVHQSAVADFDFVENTGLPQCLSSQNYLVDSIRVDPSILGELSDSVCYVIEHPRIRCISYPYEWSFSALKSAALLHLEIQLTALEYDVTLSDASAYNIQFIGSQPVFIDRLSFVPYQEGMFWNAHRQFCEQFLNPLLLRSLFGISHNAWFRGNPEGIATADIKRLLGIKHYFSRNILMHIVLHDYLQREAPDASMNSKTFAEVQFSKASFIKLLSTLKNWIETMKPRRQGKSVWHDYAKNNSYTANEIEQKKSFINEFAQALKPELLWDMGCNCGEYSIAALGGGAQYVVGFDFDQDALDLGMANARSLCLPLQFLYHDTANPSPPQGWNAQERMGLMQRAKADASIALALIHHLVIARNIPIEQFVHWLIELAPAGVVEFVPKTDAMVKKLLRFRCDIFPDYTEKHFLGLLEQEATIVKTKRVSKSGRLLIWFDSHKVVSKQ